MAWVYSTTAEGECNSWVGPGAYDAVEFYTYRTFEGALQVQLNDLTFYDGTTFGSIGLRIQMKDSGGWTRAETTVWRTWGMGDGNWHSLGNDHPRRQLRLRITNLRSYPDPPGNYWYSIPRKWFSFKLRYRHNPI